MDSAIFMMTLAVAGTFFTGLLSFLVVPQSPFRRSDYKYNRAQRTDPPANRFHDETALSKERRLFADVLKKAIGDEAVVFSNVPVTNVLAPAEGRMRWRSSSKNISDMHFDFVVCAADGSAAKFAIQLEDSSQQSKKQLKRNQFLADACESAGLPVVRIKAARGYAIGNIRERLAAALAGDTPAPA